MPDQTSTIIAGGGGDYTTIQAWENDTDVSGGFWKGVITDNSAYDETVTISGGTGTPTIANYVWLDVDASNRHSGAAGTGHGRMNIDTASGHAITVGSDFVRISNLEIKQASPGSSDEGIRVNAGIDDLLVEKCIIWTDSATADTDGIYAGNSSVTLTAVNCSLYGWQRAGFHQQNFNSTTITSRWAIEHCSIYDCGVTGEASSGGITCEADGTSTSIVYVIFNTASLGNDAAGDDYHFTSGTTTKVNWTGSNDADSDDSISARASEAADTIDTNTQANLVATTVWTDPANGDFTVVSGQGLDGNGTSFTSDDTRADVSVDITGASRDGSTPDIGCFELVSGNVQTLAATATGVANISLALELSRAIAAIANGVPSLARLATWRRNLAGTASGIASLVAATAGEFFETIAAVATGVATVNRRLSAFRTLSATATGLVALIAATAGEFFRTLSATATGVANISLGLSLSKALDATAVGTATVNRRLSAFRTLTATATGNAVMAAGRLYNVALSAIATVVATVTAVFTEAPEEPTTPFSGDAGIRMLGRSRWRRRPTKWKRRR